MSWFDIVKYNRKHYVAADKKHNDEDVIESHKKILGIVNRSKIKNKNMGRKIGAIRVGMPVITGEEFLEEPWNDANFFREVEKFIQKIDNMINDRNPAIHDEERRILVRLKNRVQDLANEINEWLSDSLWNEEDLVYVEDVYKRGAKAVLRLVGQYNAQLMRGKNY